MPSISPKTSSNTNDKQGVIMPKDKVDFINEPARKISVYKKVSVLVAGGGPGGLGAAVAAARNGSDMLLVERNSFLGGRATAAMQVWFGGHDLLTGIGKEIAKSLGAMGAARFVERGRHPPTAVGETPML